jgi:hypothetical protein
VSAQKGKCEETEKVLAPMNIIIFKKIGVRVLGLGVLARAASLLATQHPAACADRYRVEETLGHAAFSTALQCVDLAHRSASNSGEPLSVCLKVIKNNKDFFDQSLDEIKLLHYLNSSGDPDAHHVLHM